MSRAELDRAPENAKADALAKATRYSPFNSSPSAIVMVMGPRPIPILTNDAFTGLKPWAAAFSGKTSALSVHPTSASRNPTARAARGGRNRMRRLRQKYSEFATTIGRGRHGAGRNATGLRKLQTNACCQRASQIPRPAGNAWCKQAGPRGATAAGSNTLTARRFGEIAALIHAMRQQPMSRRRRAGNPVSLLVGVDP